MAAIERDAEVVQRGDRGQIGQQARQGMGAIRHEAGEGDEVGMNAFADLPGPDQPAAQRFGPDTRATIGLRRADEPRLIAAGETHFAGLAPNP